LVQNDTTVIAYSMSNERHPDVAVSVRSFSSIGRTLLYLYMVLVVH
jgi:hypothetical protein